MRIVKVTKPCKATASAGAIKCAIERDHAGHHSSLKPGQKKTWTTIADGRVEVTTYRGGKKDGNWFEGEARAAADSAIEADVPTAPPPSACGKRWDRSLDGRRIAKPQFICERLAGHDGPHRCAAPEGKHVTEWSGDGSDGGIHYPKERFAGSIEEPPGRLVDYCARCGADPCACEEEADDPLEDEVRSDADRELARKMREEREAHALELESAQAKAPSLTDPCPKCNREIGEHDGRKCPKPEKAKISKIYTKAEREQMERPTASATHCGYCDSPLDEDVCNACLSGRTPHKIKQDRAAGVVTIAGYPRHPAAALYEMLPEVELEKLAADIKANGLHEAIVILEERGHGSQDWILDGSNRARACEIAGVPPRFARYEGRPDMASLIAYVVGKNDRRRHESDAQRALRANEAATLAQGQKQTSPGSGLTQAAAGALVGVSERSVGRARAVIRDGVPELVAAVKQGKVDLKGAEQVAKLSHTEQRKLIKERIDTSKGPVKGGKLASLARQQEKRTIVRTINEQRVAPMPVGPFGVIYGDYPWLYDNSDQHEGSHGHLPYPGMEFEKIVEHARETAKRAAKDCIVALWVTNLYIPKIGLVLEAYGAEHRTMWTWPKPQIGVGGWARGQTEHLVIASIGNPVHTMNEVSTLLPSFRPRIDREHSSKPIEVAEILLKHCSGPHLELFARSAADGWSVWGAETDKFSTEAA